MLIAINNHSALELCDLGEYEAAAELAGLRVGQRPENVSGGILAQAERLLLAGIISSVSGGIRQTGNQAFAREMLTESAELFGDDPRSHVAESWLAWTDYWDGNLDTALARAGRVLNAPLDNTTRFRTLLLKAIIYANQGIVIKAFAELESMLPLYETCNPLLKGKFHLQRGRLLKLTGEIDRSIVDYYAAINFFEKSGSVRCQAVASNHLSDIYLETEHFDEAHEYSTQAQVLFHGLGDKTYEAKAWDQAAQIFLAEGKLDEADKAVCEGIPLVEHGKVLGELRETFDKIKHQRIFLESKHDTLSITSPTLLKTTCGERSEMMAPLELTSHLTEDPDKAAPLLDFFYLVTSNRDDPKHQAMLNDIEAVLYGMTADCEQHRDSYRRSRLVHEVTSDS